MSARANATTIGIIAAGTIFAVVSIVCWSCSPQPTHSQPSDYVDLFGADEEHVVTRLGPPRETVILEDGDFALQYDRPARLIIYFHSGRVVRITSLGNQIVP